MNDDAFDPRIAPIAATGRIRLALFLPQYERTATGELKSHGVAFVGHTLMKALAERIGIAVEIVERPSPPATIETLNAGGCDVMVLGFDESRTKLVDFTPGIARFDFAYLVLPGSAIEETAEVDRAGNRISVARGHASWMTLERSIAHAEIVATEVPDEAFALVRDGAAEVFALPRAHLIDYAAMLPGSRILAEGFGFNTACFAVAKGQTRLRDYIGEFVDDAKASGLVGRILDDADLTSRGFDVPS